ncbi:HsdM family class I SAM-dependent methyltransferase [Salinibaculum salinum]|uniref:HsdM family class I SAM-dependent methyltransferase n=1 Tax=Salinibaculum salinum TaxID=3131996 RepID=UPI0030ED40EB
MRHNDLPHLDLNLSEEFSELSEVESTEIIDDGVKIDVGASSLYFYHPGGPQSQLESLPEGIDRIFITVEKGLLEFNGQTNQYYTSSEADSFEEVVEIVITRQIEGEDIEIDEALEKLNDSGYLAGFTPQAVTEILAGWAISPSDEAVLDIATGTGSLLKQAAKENEEAELVGIEINPVIAKLAQARLKDISNAKILNTDFFDWNQLGQRELDKKGESRKFDAVIGNPPVGRMHHLIPEKREELLDKYPSIGPTAAAGFVAKAAAHLKEGGRGAFVLPKSALKNDLLQHLTESCSIHRIVELPIGTFNYARAPELVLLTFVKEESAREERATGIARFNRPELPKNARGLFEQPLEEIVQNRHNPYNAEIVRASHSDLEGGNVMRILSNPPIYDIVTSEQFPRLGDLPGVTVGTGIQTGDNDFFYFGVEEKDESDIDERFFRPLIKNPRDDIQSITEDQIDQYVLDLQFYVEEQEKKGVKLTEENIIEQLETDGHNGLADYIRDASVNPRKRGPYFLPQYRGKIDSVDLVIPEFFDTPRCYSVEVEDAMFDNTMIGVHVEDDQMADALSRLLNTPLYKEFFQTFAGTMNLDWYRMNIGQAKDIPIIEKALIEDMFDRMDPFFPPDYDNDLVNLNQLLIESCESDEERQALRRYLASRDNYAWSWFMTLPEFEEFQELLESDKEGAREFIVDRFDQELLDQARNTFENIGFFEERRELLNDLLMEFEKGHYRGFLAGIILQFEGVLADLVEEAGGEIIEEDHGTKFKMPGKGRSQTKNLGKLISHFFDGAFSTFLDETVRQRRNQIAHGDVIENSRELSIHFFISFYALCNAILNEYVRLAEQDQPQGPA